MRTGTIIRGIGGLYTVDTGDIIFDCRARGIFRHDKIRLTVGDNVICAEQPDGDMLITELAPRKNVLIRPAVSNLDAIVVIASTAPPETETYLIDRVFAVAVFKGIAPVLCINKADLDLGERFSQIYTHVGIPVLRVSAKTGEGIASLRDFLRGKTSALTGNSGVGKSSILSQMLPEQSLTVGELSEKLGRGKHTTRHTELYALPGGGYVADTPGFSAFDVTRLETLLREDIQYGFPEMSPFINNCRYTGCLHVKEDGCAVLEAVSNGIIPVSRYESYIRLCDELKDVRDWNRKTNH
ncbi:MAG: ribosome small subunit-dependent GTPase A [Clostridiaceae bacterium]|nr:ribosome small subunit-dependent GTPase A [Clostridiaceae bacterium]